MKRLLLSAIPALAAATAAAGALAGTRTVAQIPRNGFTPHSAAIAADDGSFPSPGSVTLSAPAAAIVYGGGSTLAGDVSSELASEPVTLTAQATGKSIESVDEATTGANGGFRFTVSPTVSTTYQAHWRTVDSRPVAIDVAPRVGFGRVGRTFVAKVTSDLSYAGRFVWLQRRGSTGWKSVRRVFLRANSRATFAATLPHGTTTLRLLLPAAQAGAGYVAGVSRTLVVGRRA